MRRAARPTTVAGAAVRSHGHKEDIMLTLWSDFDRAFFRRPSGARELNWLRAVENALTQTAPQRFWDERWPRTNLIDTGKELVFMAELPGVDEKDVELNIHKDVLNVQASRKIELPERATLHRQERGSWTFQRSISLPVPVDSERTKAVLKDGVLTVTMAISPEHEPKRISVGAD
jgi:HSP20 family protein